MGPRRAAKKSSRSGSREAAAGEAARRSVRFGVMLRVDYPVGDRRTFSFSSDLSATGVFLRSATKLEVGQTLPVDLHLKGLPQPLTLSAIVRRVVGGATPGAGLEFAPGQDEAIAAVRRFIDDEMIAKLEASLSRRIINPADVVQLGGYYLELGRHDDAMELLRRALEVHPSSLSLHESLGRLLLSRMGGKGSASPSALAELEEQLARAATVGSSAALRRLEHEAAELREAQDRLAQEKAQREQELRKREQKEREEKLRAALAREAQGQAEKELAARRRELQREH
jgi:hypothetical protein